MPCFADCRHCSRPGPEPAPSADSTSTPDLEHQPNQVLLVGPTTTADCCILDADPGGDAPHPVAVGALHYDEHEAAGFTVDRVQTDRTNGDQIGAGDDHIEFRGGRVVVLVVDGFHSGHLATVGAHSGHKRSGRGGKQRV